MLRHCSSITFGWLSVVKWLNFGVSTGWTKAAIDFNDLGDLFIPMWLIFKFLVKENAGRTGELYCPQWALIGAACELTNPSIKLSVSTKSKNKNIQIRNHLYRKWFYTKTAPNDRTTNYKR